MPLAAFSALYIWLKSENHRAISGCEQIKVLTVVYLLCTNVISCFLQFLPGIKILISIKMMMKQLVDDQF